MRCKAKMLDIAFFMVYNDNINGVYIWRLTTKSIITSFSPNILPF